MQILDSVLKNFWGDRKENQSKEIEESLQLPNQLYIQLKEADHGNLIAIQLKGYTDLKDLTSVNKKEVGVYTLQKVVKVTFPPQVEDIIPLKKKGEK